MLDKRFECKYLEWDTEYFKKDSARIDLFGILNDVDRLEIVNFAKNFEFITISNIDNINENNIWIGQNTSAFLTDVNVQYLKKVKTIQGVTNLNSKVLNNFPRNNSVLDIAKKSFKFSRFFSDPNLPEFLAKNVYLHWIECAFNKTDKYFVVSENYGTITGFILFSLKDELCIIELIAVDDSHQGKGIGKSMMQDLEAYVSNRGIVQILVGTQVNNFGAIIFYSSMEFELVKCNTIYHLWNEQAQKVDT